MFSMSSNNESAFEPSYSTIKNSAGEDDEEEEEGGDSESDELMEMDGDTNLLDEKKRLIIDEVQRKRVMMQ